MNKEMIRKKLFKRTAFIIGGVIFAAVLAFLFGIIVLYLWNWLMPEIFGLPTISYIQAWGLVLLSHILFKGGGHGGHHQRGFGRKHRGHRMEARLRERYKCEEPPIKTE